MLVVGDKEAAAGTAAVRLRSGEDLGAVTVEQIKDQMLKENHPAAAVTPA
jgi:threonyl-tRNA synthetase